MRKFLPAVLLLMLATSIYAFPHSVEQTDRFASPDDSAVITVNFLNNLSQTQQFTVSTFSPQTSWVYVEGAKTLEPGHNGTITVTITPGEYAVDNTYSMNLYLKATPSKISHEVQTSFNVQRDQKIIVEDYSLEKSTYKPGETVEGSMKVRSISSKILRNYTASFRKGEYEVNESSSPILPGGTRTLEFQMPVEKNASPGEKKVKASLYLDSASVYTEEQAFEVSEVSNISFEESSRNTLLSTLGSITVVNNGNAPVNYTVNRTVPTYITPITGFSKKPDIEKDTEDGTTYYWNIMLDPGEKFTLERSSNYWMPAVAIMGIILALVGIRKLRNRIEFEKSVERSEEGLKVSVTVENVSDRTFRNVTVKDFVPDIAEVDRNFEMAAPTVRKTGEGTKLSWDIGELESGDQRILQYTIRPKVEVEGGVELQAAELLEGDDVVKRTGKVESDFSP